MNNFEGIVRDVIVNSTLFKVCVGYALFSILGEAAMHHNIKFDHENSKPFKIVKAENVEPKSYDIDYEKIEKSKYKHELLEFVLFLKEHHSKETLINFYNNINDLELKRNWLTFLIFSGRYSHDTKRVYFVFIKALFHELLHMASTFYDKETGLLRSGFLQGQIPVKGQVHPLRWIGNGLSEGYTDYLARKYFPNRAMKRNPYHFEVNIASKIEQVVGEEKMEDLYFKADLDGLVNELTKYVPREEITKFLVAVDMVNYHGSNFVYTKSKILQKDILYIYSFLIKLYQSKLRKELDDGIIDQETYCNKLKLYINSLGTYIKIKFKKYKTFEEEEPKEKVLKRA